MANKNFVVQNGLNVGSLTIFASNGDVITGGNVSSTSPTSTLNAPVGTSSQRPGDASLGMIRYNTSTSSFEGFGAGNAWSSLGGVKSVDGKAYISAEASAGAGDDVIRVYSGSTGTSTQVMWASGGNVSILPTTQATSTTTGALQVAGGVGIAKDLWVGGNVYAANMVSVSSSVLEVSAPLVYLESSYVYPYDYDIGMYSHFKGGPANVYSHTGAVRSYANGYWGFFSNVKQEPGVSNSVNWADAGIVWDQIKAGSLVLANTTPSTSSVTGALTVAGGAGIAGNLYVGGNINFTGQVNSLTTTSGFFTGNAAGFTALYAGIAAGYSVTPNTVFQAASNFNSYTQHNFQNINSGSQSTTDWVATANNGSDTTFYVDMGIAGNGYVNTSPNNSLGTSLWPNDSYLYAQGSTNLTVGGNLVVGTTTASRDIKFIAGGVNSNNITATITSAGIMPGANLTYNLGSTTGWWNNIYGTATHALYADLAENYLADRGYQPGTVLMFGGAAEVTMADADTTRVAGVVSTNPAHLMNGGLTGEFVTPLALTGRVPCMVVGPVAKGDLMVSAGWGYAKVNNDARVGQVIGKALEDFPVKAKGVIEVVVGRV